MAKNSTKSTKSDGSRYNRTMAIIGMIIAPLYIVIMPIADGKNAIFHVIYGALLAAMAACHAKIAAEKKAKK